LNGPHSNILPEISTMDPEPPADGGEVRGSPVIVADFGDSIMDSRGYNCHGSSDMLGDDMPRMTDLDTVEMMESGEGGTSYEIATKILPVLARFLEVFEDGVPPDVAFAVRQSPLLTDQYLWGDREALSRIHALLSMEPDLASASVDFVSARESQDEQSEAQSESPSGVGPSA
jgi:hypothetical protein